MAVIAFLRGINVGGHRNFRPSLLANELSAYDVVNIGAAGTFVVRKPGAVAKFRADLLRKLPFEADVMICQGRDLVRIASDHPFGTEDPADGVTRFVSILPKASRSRPVLPIRFPADGEWLVRLIACESQFVFGEYRRHMKTIGYLGQIDKLFGGKVTTRNWNTITNIIRAITS